MTLPSRWYEICPVRMLRAGDVVREWAAYEPVHGTVESINDKTADAVVLWDDGTRTTLKARSASGKRGDVIRVSPGLAATARARIDEQRAKDQR